MPYEFSCGFIAGACWMREMLARFVEQGGDTTTAGSIRANWNPNWGEDPGQIPDEDYEHFRTKEFLDGGEE